MNNLINPSRPECGVAMSNPSSVSDELWNVASKAYVEARGNGEVGLRAAIEAIAPRIKAEGLREAAEMMVDGTGDYTDPRLAKAILARAAALDPERRSVAIPAQAGASPCWKKIAKEEFGEGCVLDWRNNRIIGASGTVYTDIMVSSEDIERLCRDLEAKAAPEKKG